MIPLSHLAILTQLVYRDVDTDAISVPVVGVLTELTASQNSGDTYSALLQARRLCYQSLCLTAAPPADKI